MSAELEVQLRKRFEDAGLGAWLDGEEETTGNKFVAVVSTIIDEIVARTATPKHYITIDEVPSSGHNVIYRPDPSHIYR